MSLCCGVRGGPGSPTIAGLRFNSLLAGNFAGNFARFSQLGRTIDVEKARHLDTSVPNSLLNGAGIFFVRTGK
jgi:hypothetical protein